MVVIFMHFSYVRCSCTEQCRDQLGLLGRVEIVISGLGSVEKEGLSSMEV